MISAFPLHVAVALVGGDEHKGAYRRSQPHGFQQIDAARDVGVEGLQRFGVAAPNQGLGRQMDDHLGLRSVEQRGDGAEVADVDVVLVDAFGQAQLVEQRRIRLRRQGQARDLGAQVGKPGT